MSYCPNCGAERLPEGRFCGACGFDYAAMSDTPGSRSSGGGRSPQGARSAPQQARAVVAIVVVVVLLAAVGGAYLLSRGSTPRGVSGTAAPPTQAAGGLTGESPLPGDLSTFNTPAASRPGPSISPSFLGSITAPSYAPTPAPPTDRIMSVAGSPEPTSCGPDGCNAVDFTVRYNYADRAESGCIGIHVWPVTAAGALISDVHVAGVETGAFAVVPSPCLSPGSGTTSTKLVLGSHGGNAPSTVTDYVQACILDTAGNQLACEIVPFHQIWHSNAP